jgi:hypothetical protein
MSIKVTRDIYSKAQLFSSYSAGEKIGKFPKKIDFGTPKAISK